MFGKYFFGVMIIREGFRLVAKIHTSHDNVLRNIIFFFPGFSVSCILIKPSTPRHLRRQSPICYFGEKILPLSK